MSEFPFQYVARAIHIPPLGLWLDAHHAVTEGQRVIVSHAHSDHTGSHHEVILTAPTARLMETRLKRRPRIEHVLPFKERREFTWNGQSCDITLVPAGHILGSAMALVEWEGKRLLYTGDFKTRPGLAAEPCDVDGIGPVDYLVMETTFGLPHYQFPDAAEIHSDLRQFCRDALARAEVPVLLAYSLGKSQELLCALADSGFEIGVHEAAWRMTRIYEEFGWRFPNFAAMTPDQGRGKVIVCPPGTIQSPHLRGIERRRIAVATGWAIDSSCRFRARADAAFPLSDHADFPDLVAFVRSIAPRQVFTVHGFAAQFAETLRDLGFDARAFGYHEQLGFKW